MDSNFIVFTGRLGKDPDSRVTPNGTSVTNMAVANNVAREKTIWWDVVAWGKLAEVANQYLNKGSRVAVFGTMDLDEWEGDDGTRRSRIKVVASKIEFLDPPKSSGATGQKAKEQSSDVGVASIGDLDEEGFGPASGFPF